MKINAQNLLCAEKTGPTASASTSATGIGAWLLLVVLPLTVIFFRSALAPWVFMWALAFAMFFGCKWLTWRQAGARQPFHWRDAAYLFGWVGLDAENFLDQTAKAPEPPLISWIAAVLKTLFGVVLLWALVPLVPPLQILLRGWVGLIGIVFLFHFGTFQLLALIWQRLGVNASPLMRAPAAATSLGDFWGHRWNSAFNRLMHHLVFRPLHRFAGPAGATMAVFLASGLIHELVISVPARGGYGLPTAYFLSQGIGLLVERSRHGRKIGLRRGLTGRCFALGIAALPAFWLFHPPFIHNVILPMLHAIGSIRD